MPQFARQSLHPQKPVKFRVQRYAFLQKQTNFNVKKYAFVSVQFPSTFAEQKEGKSFCLKIWMNEMEVVYSQEFRSVYE